MDHMRYHAFSRQVQLEDVADFGSGFEHKLCLVLMASQSVPQDGHGAWGPSSMK